MKRSWLFWWVCFGGLSISGVAVFATSLGLDHNETWGRGRVFLFLFGTVIAAVSLSLALLPDQVLNDFHQRFRHLKNRISLRLENIPVWNRLARSRSQQMYGVGILTILFSLIVYTWYASAGRWTVWPEETNYYDRLAASFQDGKLWLEEQPPTELLSLADPYDYSARKNNSISFLWDATLYQGKYYLYWGPMPALILALVKSVFPVPIGDQYLVFGFLTGMLIINTLLIVKLWQRFYPEIPVFLVSIFILLAALANPLPWMLSRGAIYEATIAGGQFFLMAGLYFAYSALETGKVSTPRLLLAMVMWTFAAWSRTSTLVPAFFLTAMVILWILNENKGWDNLQRVLPRLLLLGLPFVVCIVGIGWYNWARFGSVFETGLRYTLTMTDLNDPAAKTFSASFLVSNLGMYLFTPVKLQPAFPFILPLIGQVPAFLSPFISEHHTEELTGLFVCAPFGWLAILSTIRTGSLLRRKFDKKSAVPLSADGEFLLWILVSLLGMTLLSFSIILLYFNVTMRFLAELMSGLVLLSALGFWQGYIWLKKKALLRKIYTTLSLILVTASILISLLLAITSYNNNFQRFNPQLLRLIAQFFSY